MFELVIRLLISRATFIAALENQLEVTLQDLEGLRWIYQLKGWEQSEQGTLGSELYVKVFDETIIFAAGRALISNIKGHIYNESSLIPTKTSDFKQDR